jgi:phage FluMu gp28-like protein
VSTAAPGVFLPYQQALMESISQNAVTVVEKSRRTGYSWAAGALATLTAAVVKAAGGQDVFYMGYNLEMAREFIEYVADWAKQFAPAAMAVEEYLFTDPDNPGKDIKAFRVTFASGFKVVALPSAPRSLRGMQGLVIIDEAAFHDELVELLKAAFALLIWGGKVVVISTHNGDTNPFAELVNDIRSGRKPYALLRCTFDDALADGLYQRICYVKGTPWSAEAQARWRQEIIDFYGSGADEELFVIPSASGGSFLSLAILEQCMDPDIPVLRWEAPSGFAELSDHIREAEVRDWCESQLAPVLSALDTKARSVFGEDFGRSGDLTVLWPLLIGKDLVRRTPFLIELRNMPFRQQEQVLFYMADRLPRLQAGALDARGNGQYLAERAMQRYGSRRIAQVMLSTEWYRENMPPYKAAWEDRTITAPRDSDVLADHRALTMEKGVARIPERSKGKDGKQRHGDSAIAGAMAYAASRLPVVEYGYESGADPRMRDPSQSPDDDDDGGDGGLRFGSGAW